MEISARGRRGKRGKQDPPGIFRPVLPTDTYEVMRLFAIASRAVCAEPAQMEQVSQRLRAVAGKLVAPELTAAQECLRLWQLFLRVAQVPKQTLRIEAGKAFCRDLDSLGQRLDLPPLADWEQLPEGIDEQNPLELEGTTVELPELLTLSQVREQAKHITAAGKISATEVARLVASLSNDERRQLFEAMVGRGFLGRSDVNLLIRFLVKGDGVGPADTVLIEVLDRLGKFLLA